VVIFNGRFTEAVAGARADDGCGSVAGCGSMTAARRGPEVATPYEDLRSTDPLDARPDRDGDDLILVYTGGTTGYPKGVMWRQDDLVGALAKQSGLPDFGFTDSGTMADYEQFLVARAVRRAPRTLICPPLMHSTALNSAFTAWLLAGAVVLLDGRSFDAGEVLDQAEATSATQIIIVGDVFGRPLVAEFARRSRDLSALRHVVSAGAVCSPDTKVGLAAFGPKVTVIDSLGSSEAIGVGNSVSTGVGMPTRFSLGPNTRVVDEDGVDVEPGTGCSGRLVLRGRVPLGYYKDEAKTAQTFQLIDGERWSCRATSWRSRPTARSGRRSGFGLHQHRRREGLPRRGRADPQVPPPGGRRRGGGAAR